MKIQQVAHVRANFARLKAVLLWRLQPCHSFWHCCAAKQHKSCFGGAQEHKKEERGEALEDRARRLRQVIEDQACARKPQRSHPLSMYSSGELAQRRLSWHSRQCKNHATEAELVCMRTCRW